MQFLQVGHSSTSIIAMNILAGWLLWISDAHELAFECMGPKCCQGDDVLFLDTDGDGFPGPALRPARITFFGKALSDWADAHANYISLQLNNRLKVKNFTNVLGSFNFLTTTGVLSTCPHTHTHTHTTHTTTPTTPTTVRPPEPRPAARARTGQREPQCWWSPR